MKIIIFCNWIVICSILLVCGCQSAVYKHPSATADRGIFSTSEKVATIEPIVVSEDKTDTTYSPASNDRGMHLIFPDLETMRGMVRVSADVVIGLSAYSQGIDRISANGKALAFDTSSPRYQGFLVEPGVRTVQFQVPLYIVDRTGLIDITAIGTDGKKIQRQIRVVKGKPIIVDEGSSEEGARVLKNGRFWALLIANQHYTNGLESLDTPINDAVALKTELITHYGFKPERIFVEKDADLKTMQLALDRMHDIVEGNDSLLIFYAGHGHLDQNYNDNGYWIPTDGKAPSLKHSSGHRISWLPNSYVHDVIKASRAKHVLLISDSCYAGTFKTRSIDEPQSYVANKNFFYKKAANRSRRAITSGNFEPVADGGGDGHSVFAYHLLKILNQGDRTINAEHLFQELRDNLSGVAPQSPQYFVIDPVKDKGGDFVFVSK